MGAKTCLTESADTGATTLQETMCVAFLNKISHPHPSGWSRICFVTGQGSVSSAHAETPRAPAHEEESGTISCPKRFAPRAMGPVQKRLGPHAETPGKSTIYNWPTPPATIKEAPKLLSQRQEDGEGKQVFRKCR